MSRFSYFDVFAMIIFGILSIVGTVKIVERYTPSKLADTPIYDLSDEIIHPDIKDNFYILLYLRDNNRYVEFRNPTGEAKLDTTLWAVDSTWMHPDGDIVIRIMPRPTVSDIYYSFSNERQSTSWWGQKWNAENSFDWAHSWEPPQIEQTLSWSSVQDIFHGPNTWQEAYQAAGNPEISHP